MVDVGTEDLDGDVAARAGQHFRNAHGDGLGKVVLQPGEIPHHFAYIVNDRVLVRRTPFCLWFEHEEVVGLVQSHRVEAQFVGTCARDDALYLGNCLENGRLHALVDVGGLCQIDGRQFGGLHDDVAFVHLRHEGLADEGIDDAGQYQRDDSDGNYPAFFAQRQIEQGYVDLHRLAHQPGLFVAGALDQERGQHGNDGERQQQRSGQREHDGQAPPG